MTHEKKLPFEMSERERRAFEKLPIPLRQRIALALGDEALMPVDRRAGQHSHWHEKRASRPYVVRFPDGRSAALSPEEASSHVSCSLAYLNEVMSAPLSKIQPRHVYTEMTECGEITVTRADER